MEIAGLALMGIGLLGCFINKIPGPLIAFIGLLIINFATKLDIPTEIIIVCGVLSVISLIINVKLVPALISKMHPYGKGGSWGAFVGSVAGLVVLTGDSIVLAIAMMVGLPFVFAWLFELISTRSIKECSKRACSAFIVYLVSTVIKIAVVALSFKFMLEEMS